MKKIIILILTLTVGLGIFKNDTVRSSALNIREAAKKEKYTFLVVGIDDAAENTDALILFNYDVKENVGSFLQIPRDTYFAYSSEVKKINSIYPYLRQKGYDSKEAMDEVSKSISSAFGVNLDGYLCFTVAAISSLVDAIGGVDIDLPYDFSFSDADGNNKMELAKGKHHLTGDDAVKFIRYRSGYALGDLGRVDAQKFFLSAFVKKLKGSLNIRLLCKSAFKPSEGIVTNLKLIDILGIAIKMRGRISNAGVKFANAPGIAERVDGGRWYYFINKKSTQSVIDEVLLPKTGKFDPELRLCPYEEKYKNLYYNENTAYRVLDDDDLNKVNIKD